jgi:flagellar hook-associated protein 1
LGAKINSIMDVGKRSMMNSQNALQTVAHNIGSKDVEGYSRQRVEFQTNPPTGSGKTRMGTGSRTSAVTRINNDFIEKQIQQENGRLGMTKGRAENLQRVEDVFNEHSNKGLNKFVTDFFNAFRELSNTPESQAVRDLVRSTAEGVAGDFQRVSRQMKDIQSDIDNQLSAYVEEVNSLSSEIARLNEQVAQVEVGGHGVANDERDRRDALLKRVGELVNIRYHEGKNGSVNVIAGGNAVLVSHGEWGRLRTVSSPENGIKREGNFDIYYEFGNSGIPTPMTRQFTGGVIGGALHVRDEVCNDILAKMDGLAYNISEAVNTVHAAGFDGYGKQAGHFFTLQGGGLRDAAQNIKLTENVGSDSWRIAAGAIPNAPADNRIANAISSLQFERVMGGGSATYDDFYNGIVGELGVGAKKSYMEMDHQDAVVKQLKNIRESISGVNLDEEAIKMIEYQKTFDASAKLIKTSDELFDTVLSLKR